MILNDFQNRFRIGTVEKYHEVDAFYSRAFDAIIVGIPPMEDFCIGGASVKLFLPIFKMNFPEIVDIALPAEGVFHNLVFVSIRKTYPMQAYKIMHGLWNEADDPATAGPNISWWWTTTWTCTTPAKSSFASAPTPIPSEIQFSQKGLLMFWTMQRLKWQSEQSWALTPRGRSREKNSKGWGLC